MEMLTGFEIFGSNTHFQTKQSNAALYLARPEVTWKLVLAVCLGTGTLMTTPSANIFAPKTLFTWKFKYNQTV